MPRLLMSAALALTVLSLTPVTALGDNGFSGRPGWNVRLNDNDTQLLAAQLKQDFRTCQSIPKIYRYDCYRRSYRTGAQSLRGSQEYAPIVDALTLVERRIGAAVSSNLDRNQPNLRENLFVQHRAVTPAAVPEIKRATLAAMAEATTLLLRSPDIAQKSHFQKIAAVIESNKVLLRSALLQMPETMLRLATLTFAPARADMWMP